MRKCTECGSEIMHLEDNPISIGMGGGPDVCMPKSVFNTIMMSPGGGGGLGPTQVVTTGHVNNTPVNHPKHYNVHPSGVECIDVVEHMTFNVGNAIKYLWRLGKKGDAEEDLAKAIWYLERERELLKKGVSK